MARNFRMLEEKMSPERRARNAAAAREAMEELALSELRAMRRFTQKELAERLEVDQAAISKLENRSDIRLSTLAKVIRALGGKLELRAKFPGGDTHYISLTRKAK
jgi:DNA-binding Xre family transcriptional regulator